MQCSPQPSTSDHRNNFGFLRLVFASLVIVSHSPEILDGNRSREPLTMLFHSISFGDIAVDSFFMISGYLVTSSFLGTGSTLAYLWKRVLRIYPAFCVASLFCILLIAPFAGADRGAFTPDQLALSVLRMLLLVWPICQGAFGPLHRPVLDASMWTIPYEFRCYLLVAVAAGCGLLSRRYVILAMTIALLSLRVWLVYTNIEPGLGFLGRVPLTWFIIIVPKYAIQFFAVFATGVCFRLFRDQIRFRADAALACVAVVMLAMVALPSCGIVAYEIFGPYFVFWLAFGLKNPKLQRINTTTDISYGVYLYAWPISSLIVMYRPHILPAELIVITFFAAVLAGYASWRFVEKPALAMKSRIRRPAQYIPSTQTPL